MRIAMFFAAAVCGLAAAGCDLEQFSSTPVHVAVQLGHSARSAGIEESIIRAALADTLIERGYSIAEKASENTAELRLTVLCADESDGSIPVVLRLDAEIPLIEDESGANEAYLLSASVLPKADGRMELRVADIHTAEIDAAVSRPQSFDILIERTINKKSTQLTLTVVAAAGPEKLPATVELAAVAAVFVCTGGSGMLPQIDESGLAERSAATFVASVNSDVFHRSDCPSASAINKANLQRYGSREEAIRDGKRPCMRCNP